MTEEDFEEQEEIIEEPEEEEKELSEGRLKQLRNLKMFAGKSDDEIREFWKNRKPKPVAPPVDEEEDDELSDLAYQRRFNRKVAALKEEFGIDLNNTNDAELLKSLVRHTIQQENVDRQIRKLTNPADKEKGIDTRTLKNLGDYQRSLMTTITDLQDKLGISRKQRRAEDADDFPAFLASLKEKAKEYWEKTTHSVQCGNCKIELARYWLNFPKLTDTVHYEIECWKCHERTIYKR